MAIELLFIDQSIKAVPERAFFKYRFEVIDENGIIIREMEALRPKEELVREKTETLRVLSSMLNKVDLEAEK